MAGEEEPGTWSKVVVEEVGKRRQPSEVNQAVELRTQVSHDSVGGEDQQEALRTWWKSLGLMVEVDQVVELRTQMQLDLKDEVYLQAVGLQILAQLD